MKTDDINRFKGQLKSTIQQWGNNKIDALFPNKPQLKVFLKNGFNNILAKQDARLNKYIDGLILFAGNEQGVIDTDTMVDMVAEMFKEMEPHRFQFEMCDVVIGEGKALAYFPKNFVFDVVFGGMEKVGITVDDILELKEMFNS